MDYFKEERVKITYIADATLVFIFKEIWVRFSEQSFDPMRILAMSAAILAVAAVRTTAVRFSPVIKLDKKEGSSESKSQQVQEM
ncbi:MAG: phosphate-starvation-inducible PsiE family protein [Rubrobacteridae bacterium]|nr:phosphate-starvation-inducible PsiE family protein [Rubrobacteridae bacterium]